MADLPPPQSLLDEARWLERMAMGLVRDPHAARDLAQDAWLAAHRAGARIQGPRPAWFAGTLRRLAVRSFRTGSRAMARAQARAIPALAPSAADLIARAELHELLLAEVRALPELYRVPLLLRYYDDLPPRLVAARLDIPVRTVQTRISRALDMLRERLDARDLRGREGWVAALLLLPLTRPTSWPQPKLVLAAAAVTGAGALLVTLVPWRSDPVVPAVVASSADHAAGEAIADTGAAVSSASRVVVATAASPWGGTVVDWDGHALAAATVVVAQHRGLRWRPGGADEVELIGQPLPSRAPWW